MDDHEFDVKQQVIALGDAVGELQGRVIALEGISRLLAAQTVADKPGMTAVIASLVRGLGTERRLAEHLTDAQLQGYREIIEDFAENLDHLQGP